MVGLISFRNRLMSDHFVEHFMFPVKKITEAIHLNMLHVITLSMWKEHSTKDSLAIKLVRMALCVVATLKSWSTSYGRELMLNTNCDLVTWLSANGGDRLSFLSLKINKESWS